MGSQSHKRGASSGDRHSLQDAGTHRGIATLSIHTSSAPERMTRAHSGGSDTGPARQPVQHEERLLRLAVLLADNGRPEEALAQLHPVLDRQPNHPAALCLRGRCLAASGARPLALAAFAAALAADPCHIEALLGCAALYRSSSLLQEALDSLEKAHEIATTAAEREGCIKGGPHNSPTGASATRSTSRADASAAEVLERVSLSLAEVLTDLGTQIKLAGLTGWEAHYRRALAVNPSYAPVHYNLGVGAGEAGNSTEAIQRYSRAVELEPRYAEAWCNLGVLHRAEGRLEEAVAAHERALAAAPDLEPVRVNLAAALTDRGTALRAAGDREGGVRHYERALALVPSHVEALYNLGATFTEMRQPHKAVFMYEMALLVAPRCAEAHNNLGVLLRELGNPERAMRCYAAALEAKPNFPQGLSNLAVMYTQQGRSQEALQMLQAALMAAPDYAEAHNNLGVLQRDVGDAGAAVLSYKRACELDPDNRNAGQNHLLALNYCCSGEQEEVCAAHREWGKRFQELHPRLPPLRAPAAASLAPGRPLVVGYISPDLFTHSVSYFAEAPLRWHDPSRVRLFVYSVCARPDAKTERLQAAVAAAGGTWRDVAPLSEAELAGMIRADGVDVLVELTGHTANNRLGAMARRPAPVQVTWIGYPNSTGLAAVDYRLTDATCDPLDTRQTFTEELVRLPGSFLCYTPALDAPALAPLPALRNGFITFGSFNALAKQTAEVLRVWARLLRAVPDSRLVLKNKPFACEAVRQRYWRLLEEESIARDRVDLLPLAPATRDHLAQYSLLDISLDPWPYAGTTTTAESLYMGVPCVTLVGGCHAHNVGASLLAAVGLGEGWVTHSVDEYVGKAVEASENVQQLAALRAGLRERMLGSPLCDGPGFVRQLEDTYHGLWRRWAGSAVESGAGAPAEAEDVRQ